MVLLCPKSWWNSIHIRVEDKYNWCHWILILSTPYPSCQENLFWWFRSIYMIVQTHMYRCSLYRVVRTCGKHVVMVLARSMSLHVWEGHDARQHDIIHSNQFQMSFMTVWLSLAHGQHNLVYVCSMRLISYESLLYGYMNGIGDITTNLIPDIFTIFWKVCILSSLPRMRALHNYTERTRGPSWTPSRRWVPLEPQKMKWRSVPLWSLVHTLTPSEECGFARPTPNPRLPSRLHHHWAHILHPAAVEVVVPDCAILRTTQQVPTPTR